MFKNIIFGLGIFAAVLAMLIFSGRLPIGKSTKSVPVGDVIVWGTLPQSQIENLFQSINNTTKTYRISYYEISETAFSGKLLEALASGRGPDLIIAPYQILLEHRSRLSPYPVESFPEQTYRDVYVDGASILFSESGAIALPLSISPLVLFYNRVLFSNTGITGPPAFWDEIATIVPKLTNSEINGRLLQSAIALGAYNNIPAAKDIIMTIVAQLGQIPVRRIVSSGTEQLNVLANAPLANNDSIRPLTSSARFFTQFADPNKNTYTWSPLMPQAQDQFLAEKLAMYVGYSDEETIMRAKNPRLDFGIKFLPQTKGYPLKVTGMKLYGVGMLNRSSNPFAARTAQYLLSGAQYGPILASAAGGLSPLKSILNISTDPSLKGYSPNQDYIKYKDSMLLARGWYDANQFTSNQLIQTMLSDILSGRKNISEAADAFVTTLSETYTR